MTTVAKFVVYLLKTREQWKETRTIITMTM